MTLSFIEKYQCKQCDHQATNTNNLKLHVNKVHEGLRYSCEFRATQSNLLKSHIEYVDMGIRYQCKNCDFEAKGAHILKKYSARFQGSDLGVTC